MTQYQNGDEEETLKRIAEVNENRSWLRHGDASGDVDRLLLIGATEMELAEARPTWRKHRDHLRSVHNVRVECDQYGVWSIVGVMPANAVAAEPIQQPGPANLALAAEFADGSEDPDDADAEQEADLADHGHPHHHAIDRIGLTAKALSALAEREMLTSPLIKNSVNLLIRQASESNHWHNCAHYRSAAARQVIERAQLPIRSAAGYQKFCTKHLRHEHVVPNHAIYRMLCEQQDHTETAIAELLRRFCIRATITREEDALLNAAGLAKAMPQGFHTPGHALYMNPMARYIHIGLADSMEVRGDRLWFNY